ncbi:MAG: IS110 family transposase [Fuerstiella sp.]
MQRTQNRTVNVGIDWADTEHVFHIDDGEGNVVVGTMQQSPKDIEETINTWSKRFPNTTFALAIEASKGPLINGLLRYEDIQIFPINPAALANYRKSFAHGGGKNDPADAQLLCDYLRNYRSKLRVLRRNEPLTEELAALGEDRRRFVDQRTKLANELTALLKRYFPAVLQLKAAKPYAEFLLKFLAKYPSLDVAQKAGVTKLRSFFHGLGLKRNADERANAIVDATALTEDEVVIRTSVRRVNAIIAQLMALNTTIRRYEADIIQLVPQHDDFAVVKDLPGASHNTHCRIIAAMGDDRSRFPTANSLQAACGIAPLTHQSGRQRLVTWRWAASKFLRQTFHEYAGLSLEHCAWARAFYDHQLSKGKTSQMARRALAYKWLRIIHRCWRDQVAYDDGLYMTRLKEAGSPLAEMLS